jgi:hypothetical protein
MVASHMNDSVDGSPRVLAWHNQWVEKTQLLCTSLRDFIVKKGICFGCISAPQLL